MKCQCLPHGESPAITPGIRHAWVEVLLGTGRGGLEQEGGENQNSPRVPDGSKGSDTGDGADQTTIPEEHERPRDEQTDDEDEGEKTQEEEQTSK